MDGWMWGVLLTWQTWMHKPYHQHQQPQCVSPLRGLHVAWLWWDMNSADEVGAVDATMHRLLVHTMPAEGIQVHWRTPHH
jgi:hypothetical protein